MNWFFYFQIFKEILRITLSLVMARCNIRLTRDGHKTITLFGGGMLMKTFLQNTAVEMGKEASQILTAVSQFLIKRRDKRRIEKCAKVLASSNLYERYFVSLLGYDDRALLYKLLLETPLEGEDQHDNQSN